MNDGDRMCPECDTDSLVEKGLTHLVCLNPSCKLLIHIDDLDDGEDWDDPSE